MKDNKFFFRGEFDPLNAPLRGANLIEAGAGTGKTHAITVIYLRLLIEAGLSVKEILVVTYTVAATNELTDRIRKVISAALRILKNDTGADGFLAGLSQKLAKAEERARAVERLTRALADFDEAAIYTIHSFCRRVLQENAFASGELFDTELITDDLKLREEVVEDFWRRNFYETSQEFAAYALNRKIDPGSLLKFSRNSHISEDLLILPETEPPVQERQESIVADLKQRLSELRDQWPSFRGESAKLLMNPALKKNIYGERVAALISEMDIFLSPGAPSLFPCDFFKKFSAAFIASAVRKGTTPPEHPFFELCQQILFLSGKLQEILEKRLLYVKRELLLTLTKELPLKKQDHNVQYFDDLLLRLRHALFRNGGKHLTAALRKQYRAALIDEFQDTDPVQYAIFSEVFRDAGNILFLIGDPKQAIYSFRGADIFAYLAAGREVDSVYTLTANWRSEPTLIKAVNTLFSMRTAPFVFPEIEYRDASSGSDCFINKLIINGIYEPPMMCWLIDAGDGKPLSRGVARPRIARALAAEIARLIVSGRAGKATIGKRRVQAEDIAILVRTNQEAILCRDALAELKIPAVLHSAESIFSSHEAAEMERFLLAVRFPDRDDLMLAALAADMIGCDLQALNALKADEVLWEDWHQKFQRYHELSENAGLLRMFRFFIDREGVRERLLSFAGGERRLTNLLHLAEALQKEAEEKNMTLDLLLQWFARKMDNPAGEEHQLRLETDSAAVEIVTIHKSKGLQYPIVFCPFLWGGFREPEAPLFYHERASGQVCDLGSNEYPAHLRQTRKELLAEEIRLFYVALTRAVNSCTFVWGWINKAGTSAPAYLLHGEEDGEEEDIVTAAAKNYHGLSGDSVRARMQEIVAASQGAIELLPLPDCEGITALPRSSAAAAPVCREFDGVIDRSWRVASFSYLAGGGGQAGEYPDRDAMDNPQVSFPEREEKIDEDDPILNFPPGSRAGVLLHEILEQCDFTKRPEPVLPDAVVVKLRENGFNPGLQGTVLEMIDRVIHHPLIIMNINRRFPDIPDGEAPGELIAGTGSDRNKQAEKQEIISLSEIGTKQRLNELEFYFPLKNLSQDRLRDIFSESGVFAENPRPDDFIYSLRRIQFEPLRGFMKGFMDMVFNWKGRWFLVDWKSNFLGKSRLDYRRDKLPAAMAEHKYMLQYYIYLLALHAYLKLRQPDYDYRRHFGGVFYLFLRGMNPAWGGEYGVYYDLPAPDSLFFLSRELMGPPE